jgi:L-iditol 2-dehydrogenase
VLKVAGCGSIIAVEPQAHRRALAEKLGADATFASVADIPSQSDRPTGAALVIEATNSPEGFADAVRAAAIGGRIVLVGIPDGDVYHLPAAEARRRGLSIRFSRRMGHVYPRAIELIAHGRVDVRALVTRTFALEQGPDAFRRHARSEPGLVKSIIFPDRARLTPTIEQEATTDG